MSRTADPASVRAMGTKTIAYLAYGLGPHVAEIAFSILTAVRHRGSTDDFEIVVLTDHAESFAGLPINVVRITDSEVTDWAGPMHFGHRRKILALQKVIQTRGTGAAVLVDGDTYFRRSPQLLFDRLSSGKSLMHVREGKLGLLAAHGYMRVRLPGVVANLDGGEQYTLRMDTVVHNAGLVGLNHADIGLLDQVLELTDRIHAAAPSWLSEQVAFSVVLGRHTVLGECRDIVFHYHEKVMRGPFRQRLPVWLKETESMPVEQRATVMYRFRPTPPLSKKWKAFVKRICKKFGFFQHDLQTSI